MKKLLFVFALLVGLNAASTVEYKDIEFLGMENFSVEKKNGQVYVGFDYIIKNPNWYNLVIMPSSLLLTIADQKCGWVEVENKVKVLGKETKGYHFVLVGNESQFVKSSFSSIWNMMTGKGIGFNINGNLKAGLFFFKKKWPVNYTYTMTMDEFLSFF